MSAQAGVRQLANMRLVHQIDINQGFENRGRQFHRADFLTLHVQNIDYHSIRSLSPGLPVTACALH
jgi:hypothetical protein